MNCAPSHVGQRPLSIVMGQEIQDTIGFLEAGIRLACFRTNSQHPSMRRIEKAMRKQIAESSRATQTPPPMRVHRFKASFQRFLVQRTINRCAAWACIMAVAVLSLVSGEQMTRTGLSGHFEHVLAYVGTAFITAAAYGERTIIWATFALLTYAGALEFLQRFSHGRTSRIEDYMFSGVGVLIGVGAFALLSRLLSLSNEPASRP
jgi:hypothetical protein